MDGWLAAGRPDMVETRDIRGGGTMRDNSGSVRPVGMCIGRVMEVVAAVPVGKPRDGFTALS